MHSVDIIVEDGILGHYTDPTPIYYEHKVVYTPEGWRPTRMLHDWFIAQDIDTTEYSYRNITWYKILSDEEQELKWALDGLSLDDLRNVYVGARFFFREANHAMLFKLTWA